MVSVKKSKLLFQIWLKVKEFNNTFYAYEQLFSSLDPPSGDLHYTVVAQISTHVLSEFPLETREYIGLCVCVAKLLTFETNDLT